MRLLFGFIRPQCQCLMRRLPRLIRPTNAPVGRIRRLRRIRLRFQCLMRRLPRLIRPTNGPRRTDKAFTPHPATIPMPDATLAASYQAYKWLPRRTDKAFTPHPATIPMPDATLAASYQAYKRSP